MNKIHKPLARLIKGEKGAHVNKMLSEREVITATT